MEALLVEAVNLMRSAINSGDWTVDGACDPDAFLQSAEHALRQHGYVQNAIDGHWQ